MACGLVEELDSRNPNITKKSFTSLEVVAQFINQHTKSPKIVRAPKETLDKAKQMQQGDFRLSTIKDEVNKKAHENLEKQKKPSKKV